MTQMRVIARRTLREFLDRHPQAVQPLKSWFKEASNADWKGPVDVKRLYRYASVIAGNRVVFNVGGNKFRLVVQINYEFRIVYVRFVGTHAEYDKIDAETI